MYLIIQPVSLNATYETCSETKLKTGQIQDREHFEILDSKHSSIKAMHRLVIYRNWLTDSIQIDRWQ